MCIAIIKPKNVGIPTEKFLNNCFKRNPHGAGFAYSVDGSVLINKGFENFANFYKKLMESNIESETVFIHFRIANRGNKDRGNTHPFPISNNLTKLRLIKNNYTNYAIIHNGLFDFTKQEYNFYDPLGVISDTMLFAMKLHEKIHDFYQDEKNIDLLSAVAFNLLSNTDKYSQFIEETIKKKSKFAILDNVGNYQKYGDWIEDNGVFYSNESFKPFVYVPKKPQKEIFSQCNICKGYFVFGKIHKTKDGCCCSYCYEKRFVKNKITFWGF